MFSEYNSAYSDHALKLESAWLVARTLIIPENLLIPGHTYGFQVTVSVENELLQISTTADAKINTELNVMDSRIVPLEGIFTDFQCIEVLIFVKTS